MTNALTVSGLTKTYPDFVLDQVSFSVPSGSIVGLIGENGAGKSTTINAALGLIGREAGRVSISGSEELDSGAREEIGVVFDGSNYPDIRSPRKISAVMKRIYRSWDEAAFFQLLKKLSLPPDKQIRQFSKGMKMKLAISAALSRGSESDICRLLLTGEAQTLDLSALTRSAGSLRWALTLRDHTRVPRDLWAREGEDSLTGLFLRGMRQKIELASDEERPTLEKAVRFGLAALENGEDTP